MDGPRKELTSEQRGGIIYGHQNGDSYRTIAARVGCSKTAVAETVKRFLETGSTEPQAARSGRPPLIRTPPRNALKKIVTEEDRHLSTSQVTNLFNTRAHLNVSKSTIRRALYKENLKCRIARPKPLISEANAIKRLNWCLARENWTIHRFRRVLWSDESTVTQFQQGTCSRVWRLPEEEWNVECLSSTVKHSPSRMYWGCFSWYGVGPLIPLQGSVTAAVYVETLQEFLLPELEQFPGHQKRGRPLFQQDNARPHTAKVTTNFFTEHGIRVLDWPAQSPDLNPIENLWHEVKKTVYRYRPKPKNLTELDDIVLQAWQDIPPELCRQLVDSMPNRVSACIAAHGGPTKY